MLQKLGRLKQSYLYGKEIKQVKYRIISHQDNYQSTNKIYVKVQVQGTRTIFIRPVEELYRKDWIEEFSKEDAAFIAVLFCAEKNKDKELIYYFPRKKQKITKNVVFLGMLFISFLVLSNITASKLVSLDLSLIPILGFFFPHTIEFPSALVFFPLTYFLDNALTEVYGFKISRFVIWCGLFCNCMVSLAVGISIKLSPALIWAHQKEYELVLGSTWGFFIASSLATIIGEFVNSVLLSKIKVLTSGKWLWMRVITSSSVGVAIDSLIFCFVAFYNILPTEMIWKIVITQYIFKVSYEVLALPLTYLITGYLKGADKVNSYDYSTSYNPFSLRLS